MSEKEENLDTADLPTLHKKYLTKVIISSILFVFFISWGVFSMITYAFHPDYEGVTIAWGIIYTLSMIIAPILGIGYLSKIIKNSKLLRSIIHKQKNIPPKDKEKYYIAPDPATITLFEKKSSHAYIYLQIITIASFLFTIFFMLSYFHNDPILRLANLIPDEPAIIFDIFLWLGFLSMVSVVIMTLPFFMRREMMRESKERKNPVGIFKSLRNKSEDTFSRTKTVETWENPPEEPEDTEMYEEEDKFTIKGYVASDDVIHGNILIWGICYTIGIPLKILLPIYILPTTLEFHFVIHIFNFLFLGLFLVTFTSYLIEMIPVWRTIKSLEIKKENKQRNGNEEL